MNQKFDNVFPFKILVKERCKNDFLWNFKTRLCEAQQKAFAVFSSHFQYG
jgi:hypothetical protein